MDVKYFDDHQQLIDAVVDLLTAQFTAEYDVLHAVMLSGGKTPLDAYNTIARNPFPVSPTLRLFFSDERMVPADSPESNFGNASPMIDALGIASENVFCVDTSLTLDDAGGKYNHRLANFLTGGGRITLGLLGLGTDGHTASLFSVAGVEWGPKQLAFSVPHTPKPDRVSITPGMLRWIEKVIFVVTGSEKSQIAQTLIDAPETIAAGQAIAGAKNVSLWLASGQS